MKKILPVLYHVGMSQTLTLRGAENETSQRAEERVSKLHRSHGVVHDENITIYYLNL